MERVRDPAARISNGVVLDAEMSAIWNGYRDDLNEGIYSEGSWHYARGSPFNIGRVESLEKLVEILASRLALDEFEKGLVSN